MKKYLLGFLLLISGLSYSQTFLTLGRIDTIWNTTSVPKGLNNTNTWYTLYNAGRNLTFQTPLSISTNTVSIANSAADGATKGAASFTANDFDASSGNISLDYTNGQKATSLIPGFLTSADWTIFNSKVGGSGATNTIPKFTASSTLGNSQIVDDGTGVLIGGATATGRRVDILQGTARVILGADPSNTDRGAIWLFPTGTPTTNNHNFSANATNTIMNCEAGGNLLLRLGQVSKLEIGTSLAAFQSGVVVSVADRVLRGTATTSDALADALFSTSATTQKGLVIQGKVGQTANLFEIQTSTGSIQMAASATGRLGIGTGSPLAAFHLENSSLAEMFFKVTGGKQGGLITGADGSAFMFDATGYMEFATITGAGAAGYSAKMRMTNGGNLFIGGNTNATAKLHITAGTAAANTAPLKFTSGTSMTSPEAGAVEFTTDDLFFTITTGAARKGFVFTDGSNLTTTRIPFATTNGRLIDNSAFNFSNANSTLGLGTTATANDAFIISKTFNANTSTRTGQNIFVNHTGGVSGGQTLIGQDIYAQSSLGNVPAQVQGVLGMRITVEGNAAENFNGGFNGIKTTLKTTSSQSGSISTAQYYVASTPTWSGTMPTTLVAYDIENLGVTGQSTVYGLRIANQTNSTNRYGIAIEDNFNGIGTLTPRNRLEIGTLTTTDALPQLAVSTASAANKGIAIQGVTSQSGNLLEGQDNTGALQFGFASNGNLGIGVTPNATDALVISRTFSANNATFKQGLNVSVDNTQSSALAASVASSLIATCSSSGTSTPAVTAMIMNAIANSANNFTTGLLVGAQYTMKSLAGQTGTIADAFALEIAAPSWAGSKPTTNYGQRIRNQGNASTTTSAALRIDTQSGSTSNYGIITQGTASLNGFGTLTPTAHVHMGAGTTTVPPLQFTSGTDNSTALDGAMEYDGTNLHFTNNGLQRQQIPLVQPSRVTSQFDKTSNTTTDNITGLTATLVAGKTYTFEAILYTTSNIAGGVKFAMDGTATHTSIVYEAITTNAAVVSSQGRAAAINTDVAGVTAVTAAYCRITGTCTVNAGGTLTVQFAQNASNGAASSVLVGSQFTVTQIQ